jgi:hypothetical protein
MTSPLDSTDLKMVRVALCYYVRAHELSKRAVPPAAARLAAHLEIAVADDGHTSVVPQPQWITTAEAAARLGRSPRTVRRIAQRCGRKIGRTWFIPLDALPTED